MNRAMAFAATGGFWLGLVSALGVLLAPLGYRLGVWDVRFALLTLVKWATIASLAAFPRHPLHTGSQGGARCGMGDRCRRAAAGTPRSYGHQPALRLHRRYRDPDHASRAWKPAGHPLHVAGRSQRCGRECPTHSPL